MAGPVWVAVLLALAIPVAGCGHDADPASPSAASSADDAKDAVGVGTPETRRAVSPVHLDIPAIKVSTSLIGLGLNPDRTVEVPADPARAGWFELGTVPGQRGSSVILGHVDSPAGPAVFAGLASLRVGDRVEVGLSDGTVAAFRVRRVATFANADFPAQLVYAGTPGRASLNLVTCGGEYDRDRGGYQSNVVVFTTPVAA